MIRSFEDKETKRLFEDQVVLKFQAIAERAKRKLVLLDAAAALDDLRHPPSNRLEALKGEWKGYYSVRINDQWRVVFRWVGTDAFDVAIVDYH